MGTNDEMAIAGAEGIRWPRLYDLMVLLLTRGRDRTYRKVILDLAQLGPGSHVLDVGCGTGTLAIDGWRRVRPGRVTGTDISEPMLARARAKARRAGCEIDFLQADAARLPFADRSFDVALMTTVLHMVPGPRHQDALGEMARVLKPGGRALIVDYGGALDERNSTAARHGRHGAFDLYTQRDNLLAAGFAAVDAGPLGWLDLHYLRATLA